MKNHTTGAIVGIVVFMGIMGFVGCKPEDRDALTPNAPIHGRADQLANYAQMSRGSVVVDGQQINWVVSEWGAFPYGEWMYLEVNQQDVPGKQPGEGQIPVTLRNVVLRFSDLPTDVTDIVIGVKAVHDDADQTFTERGRFAVVNGTVEIPVDEADLVSYFGVTHYSLWFQAVGGDNGVGEVCGRLTLTGELPGGQGVTFDKAVCFGTNPPTPVSPSALTCQPINPADPCQVQNGNDAGAGSLRVVLTTCPAGGTITFACGVTDIQLTTNDGTTTHVTLTRNVTIDGTSAGGVTISGNNTARVFHVNSSVTVALNGLTITGGNASNSSGGGIVNYGTLTIGSATTVRGNTATYGGGIFNTPIGTLTVNGTVSSNTAVQYGGGIVNAGMLTVNGTVSSNTAVHQYGGGIVNWKILTVNGTVSDNTAVQDGGGIVNMSGILTLQAGNLIQGNRCNTSGGSYTGGGIKILGCPVANANYGTHNFNNGSLGTPVGVYDCQWD